MLVIYFSFIVLLVFFIVLCFILYNKNISEARNLNNETQKYGFLEGHDVILGSLFSMIFIFVSFYSTQYRYDLIYKKNKINFYNSLIQKNNFSKKIIWTEIPEVLINKSKIRPIYSDLLLHDFFKDNNFKFLLPKIFKFKLIKIIFLFIFLLILISYLSLYISFVIQKNNNNFYLWYEWINLYAIIYIVFMVTILLSA